MKARIHKLLLAAGLLLCGKTAGAQTFSATGGAIPDAGPVVAFPIEVSGLGPAALNTTFGLETVCINLTHTWDADLTIRIQAPDGTIANLSMNSGGDGDNYTNTCFNQSSPDLISLASAPFTGVFRPSGQISAVNNGQNGNGTWNLLVQDQAGQDEGELIDVSITFGNNPPLPVVPSGRLPLIVINTNGNTIQDEPKVQVRMGVVDNGPGNLNLASDPWNAFNGWAGIEYRGYSSLGFPQRSYSIETRDTFGSEVDTTLLGMPAEHDWLLIASYVDKSLMRNVMTYELGRLMGQPYVPRTRFCEVVVDGQYQGVYTLTEKIKRDPNRVNIAKLNPEDTTGDQLTGGYIFRLDHQPNPDWISNYNPPTGNGWQVRPFYLVYPKPDAIMPAQKDYIHGYCDSFENALHGPQFTDSATGWRQFADQASFIDYFLINEASRNLDAYRASAFFYKDKQSKGGKLMAGPLWDYNLAWWNGDFCNSQADTGWAYNFGVECPDDEYLAPFWWTRLLEDTTYANAMQCRWQELRSTVFDTTFLFHYIDSTGTSLDSAQAHHFTQWPIMGIYVWPNPSPLATSYAGELQHMKEWIVRRFTWLDANLPGVCWPPPPPPATAVASMSRTIGGAYPNPFADRLRLDVNAATAGEVHITLRTVVGAEVWQATQPVKAGMNNLQLPVGRMAAGTYLLHIAGAGINGTWKVISSGE